MNDEYLDAFIRESEEAITELNNSLLDLESDPEDTEAMDRIFRTAHTLKGNFGAMGFEDAANLAHAIEDLLDAIRQGEMSVTPEIMDLVFAGVDEIETIVGQIEAEGEAHAETDDIVAELRAALEAGGAGGDADEAATSAAAGETTDETNSDTGPSPNGDLPDIEPERVTEGVVRATVDIGESDMAGVDSMLAIEAIEGACTLIDSIPDRDRIEDGDYEGAFDVFVDAADPATVQATLDDIGKIERVSTSDVTAAVEAAASAEAGEADGGAVAESDEPDAADEDAEDALDVVEEQSAVQEIKSVRVDVGQLDDLHGLVEQLVTSRIKLRRAVEDRNIDTAGDSLNELDKITASLQNTVMDMRLIPLKNVVGKFPRMVRDLSRELDKDVDFEIVGEDIELDRTILTEISDPLMHIIRNSLDHGIEPPAEREAVGKDPTGSLELRASRERDHVIIEVEDDGAGLDVEAIRRKAAEKGVRSSEELETMPDSAIYDLIFHPGFSTADEVSETSGRGVGMDVVHDTVSQLDGTVDVDSTPGHGTTVTLRLPVTMAIVKVLFVEVGDEEYGVPLKNVDEITRTGEVTTLDGREVVRHNEEIYPVIDLGATFEVPGETKNGDSMLVRVRSSERQVALRCDAVKSQEEVVVKPLEGILSGTQGLSGTAVLGDGNIVHILDVVTL
mgnify:CR=1 FL=1